MAGRADDGPQRVRAAVGDRHEPNVRRLSPHRATPRGRPALVAAASPADLRVPDAVEAVSAFPVGTWDARWAVRTVRGEPVEYIAVEPAVAIEIDSCFELGRYRPGEVPATSAEVVYKIASA
jgi:hypothetical protein